MRQILTLGLVAGVVATMVGCGNGAADDTQADLPSIVVTTNVLGDVVDEVVGDLAVVEVIMPLGANPHDFAPSARQAELMENADLLVINGAGFEQGMLGVIESVERSGTDVFAFADAVDLLELDDAHDDDDHHDDQDDDHDTDDHDEHSSTDPHIWTDPTRIAAAVAAFGAATADSIESVEPDAVAARVERYVGDLDSLDAEIADMLSPIGPAERVMVTNHEVFGYFADRYDFEIVGAVVPSLTTDAEASARELVELADLMDTEGINVIFTETTQSTELADALAEEVGGDVEVVSLFTESLGGPGSGAETYIEMMRSNARLIADSSTGG